MLSCTGTTSSLLVVSAFGGSSGLPASRLRSSSLTLVCLYLTLGTPGIILTVYRVGFIYFASYTYFTSTYWPHIPNAGKCAGEEYAAYSGVGVISSYLFLFVSFYFATYSKNGKPAAKKTVSNGTNGVSSAKASTNGTVRSRKA